MNIPINETPPTEDEMDIVLERVGPDQTGHPSYSGQRIHMMKRAEALELYPDAMVPAEPAVITVDGPQVLSVTLLREALTEAFRRAEVMIEWPMPLVISDHHAADPAFMELLGDQPYVVTPRHIPVERHLTVGISASERLGVQVAAKIAMKEIYERGMEAYIEPAPCEPMDYRPKPTYRERFPNDPVRNRRARSSQRPHLQGRRQK